MSAVVLTDEVRERARTECAAQGVPFKVADPAQLAQLARIVRGGVTRVAA